MTLTKDGQGLAFTSAVLFDADIPMPDTTPPTGEAKFVDRGAGRGAELGFIVKTKMDKLDISKLPAKYKKTEKHGDYTHEPTDTVVYTGRLEFTLKDADGFVLMTTDSEPVEIWSGQENTLQGIAKDAVPRPLAIRTKQIQVQLDFDKCETCRP